MISIQLNGENRLFEKTLTLEELLRDIKIAPQSIAVAINSEIVPRSTFQQTIIRDQDNVEIVHAVGGG